MKVKEQDSTEWTKVYVVSGVPGPDGVTPNITFEVETLASGATAKVTKSGTDANPIIKLSIPRGATNSAVDTSTLVAKTGNRGQLAGYEVPDVKATAALITADSNNTTQMTSTSALVNSTITVANGIAGTAWIKTVYITDANYGVSFASDWLWSGGKIPTITENCMLILYWCNDRGLAYLVA